MRRWSRPPLSESSAPKIHTYAHTVDWNMLYIKMDSDEAASGKYVALYADRRHSVLAERYIYERTFTEHTFKMHGIYRMPCHMGICFPHRGKYNYT